MRLSFKDAATQLDRRGIRVSKLHGRYCICDTATGTVHEGLTGADVVRVAKRFNALDEKLLKSLENLSKNPMSKEELAKEARRENDLERRFS